MTTTDNGLSRYARHLRQVTAAIDALGDAAGQVGRREIATQLAGLAEQMQRDVLRVAFVGWFDAGKSTLIDALLGHDVLPADLSPTTAVITVIRHGEPRAVLIPRNSNLEPIEVPIDRVREFLVIGADDTESPYARVEVYWPNDLLVAGVEFADTPGVGDAKQNRQARLDAVIEYVASADIVVFVSPSIGFMGQKQRDFIYDVLHPVGHTEIFLACTRADDMDKHGPEHRERLKDKLRRDVAELVPAERLFFVNGWGALLAQQTGDTAAWTESGVAHFEKSLRTFLLDRRASIKLGRALLAAERIGDELSDDVQAQRAAMEEEAVEVHGRCNIVEERLPIMNRQVDSMLHTITPTLSRLEVQTAIAAEQFLRTCAERCPEWIADMPPPERRSLTERLRVVARIKEAAANASDYLAERLQREVARWQRETLAPLLAEHADELRRSVEPEMREFTALYEQSLGALDRKETGNETVNASLWRLAQYGDVDLEGSAMDRLHQLLEDARKVALVRLAAGVIASGLGLIWSLAGLTMAAVLGGVMAGASEMIVRNLVAKTFANGLRGSSAEWAGKVRGSVAEHFGLLRETLRGDLEGRIADLRDRIGAMRATVDGDGTAQTRRLDRATEAITFARSVVDEVHGDA